MKWSDEAEKEVSRVPFFVRKRVRKKVEEEATRMGSTDVRLEHVKACQQRFLKNMEPDVKGYQVETCFGPGGCPNRAVSCEGVAEKVEELLAERDLRSFLKSRVDGPLKMHHEFRISISDCPNACSRPQIVDIGLVGARQPGVSQELCSQCGSCAEACKESAIHPGDGAAPVRIDPEACLSCGKCLSVCPTDAIAELKQGYRILLGGKLGRHPQLGKDLGRIFSLNEALELIDRCLDLHMKHNKSGERFGEVLNRIGIESI